MFFKLSENILKCFLHLWSKASTTPLTKYIINIKYYFFYFRGSELQGKKLWEKFSF